MRATWPLLVSALIVTSCGSDATNPTTETDPDRPSTSTTPDPTAWTDIMEEGSEALAIDDADWVQVIDGHAWTTVSGGWPTIQQLDAVTGEPGAAVRTSADTCTAMDVGYDALWAADCSQPSSSVVRIDPTTGARVARVRLEGVIQYEGSVASAEGSVWVVTTSPRRRLVRIDPRTNRVVAETPLPPGVAGVRAGLGGLWATDPDRGELLRLDPATGDTIATIEVGAGARFFAVGEGGVWVQNNTDGTVSRVDPSTNEVVDTIVVDDGAIDGGDLAVGGGFVWARVSSWLVSKIDPATNTVVARYGPAAGSGSVAADEHAVWISAHDVDLVYRLPLD